MSSSQDDTILPPPRKPIVPSGFDGETILPSNNTTGIHNPGDVIDNRYKVIREIGRGGMGVVYEVEDAVTSIRYAIKRLLPDVASNEQIVRAFVREGTAAERFSATSRYLVTTKSVGRDSAGFYVLMEMVTSPTLRQILKQISAGGLQPNQATPILASIADALNDMHRSGLIHRDLKPENIFVTDSADTVAVQLVDFGLTRNATSHTVTGLSGAGSLRYMAPELFREETATAAADVYAFGVIAYELLTGELPSFGDRLTDYVPNAAPELVRLVTACLAGKAEKRPQSSDQLVSQIAALLTIRDQIEKPSPNVTLSEPKVPEPQPVQPTVVLTTLSFEGVQDGAIVEVDKTNLVKPYVHNVEIETNARKAVSVLIRWQDQVVFEKQIILVAGANQSIKVPQAYRIECAVPDWCSVKDTKRNKIRFPVKGLLADCEREAKYILVYDGAEFDTLTMPLKVGVNILKFKYGLASLRVVDVPLECHIFVNGTEKKSDFTVPLIQGRPATLAVVVKDPNHVEVYREILTIVAGETKTIRVPVSGADPAVDRVSTQQTVTTSPTTVSVTPSASTVASTLTRRLLIGGGIAGAIGGGWLVSNRLFATNTRYKTAADKIRVEYPHLADYVESLCSIPAGTFQMGSVSIDGNEVPVHQVTLSSYRMGATPVTFDMWDEYCAATLRNPPETPTWKLLGKHPVVNVSWNDIMGLDGHGGFCGWASNIIGYRLSLPTEAQFEYAAYGGVEGIAFPWGNAFDDSKVWSSNVVGRFSTAIVHRSTNVFRNAFGLTDISGNVWEWCIDYFAPYTSGPLTNPMPLDSFSDVSRCLRGGSWNNEFPADFRCANRFSRYPDVRGTDVGFRLSAGPG